jgi:hypothetical protein
MGVSTFDEQDRAAAKVINQNNGCTATNWSANSIPHKELHVRGESLILQGGIQRTGLMTYQNSTRESIFLITSITDSDSAGHSDLAKLCAHKVQEMIKRRSSSQAARTVRWAVALARATQQHWQAMTRHILLITAIAVKVTVLPGAGL